VPLQIVSSLLNSNQKYECNIQLFKLGHSYSAFYLYHSISSRIETNHFRGWSGASAWSAIGKKKGYFWVLLETKSDRREIESGHIDIMRVDGFAYSFEEIISFIVIRVGYYRNDAIFTDQQAIILLF
jgi:hypothetical protein